MNHADILVKFLGVFAKVFQCFIHPAKSNIAFFLPRKALLTLFELLNLKHILNILRVLFLIFLPLFCFIGVGYYHSAAFADLDETPVSLAF